jgi:hypothetical protein
MSQRAINPRASREARRLYRSVDGVQGEVNRKLANGTHSKVTATRKVTEDTQVRPDDHLISVLNCGSGRIVTLPNAVGNEGKRIIVEDRIGGAGANNITVNTSFGQTISGSATSTIGSNYGVLTVRSDGENWIEE